MRQLAAVRDQFDVAVVHLPDGWGPGLRGDAFNAHDELKAIGAELGIPTQGLNDRTFTFEYVASVAWRLAIALYVKAGGTPWRLAPLPEVPPDSAYIGLAYALRGGAKDARFVTCCSQVFKTTAFEDDELAGASDALTAVREAECVQVTTDVKWRGIWLRAARSQERKSEPDGYPVHRGTMIPLSGTSAIVWVAGNAPSVARRGDSYYQGGKSIPSPLLMTRHMGRGPLETIASELLALTKMDWNNDALYDREPVTIGYAKRLARTIANVPSLARSVYPYRMFM